MSYEEMNSPEMRAGSNTSEMPSPIDLALEFLSAHASGNTNVQQQKSSVVPAENPGGKSGTNSLFDTTDQHKNHLYDLNCRICMSNKKEPNQDSNKNNDSI